jgi:hypothetical protein
MQVVKDFPADTATERLSIRTKGNKFFVFKDKKRVSSELGNFQLAEAEIERLLLARKSKSTAARSSKKRVEAEIPNVETVLKIKNCKFCSTQFETPNKRGFFRKIFCSKACCLDYHNSNRKDDKKLKAEVKDVNCIICGTLFSPTKSNHVCCTQKCSNINSIQKKKYSHIGDHSFLTLEANNKVKENLASTYFVFTIGSSETSLPTEKGEELEVVLLDGSGNRMQVSSYGLNKNLGPFKLQLEIKAKTKK